jgi:voltage-gated potassium channel
MADTDRSDELKDEREQLLQQVQDLLETPMIVLGFAWLVLLIVDLVWGLRPFLAGLMTLIWIIFILDFLLRFWLAPERLVFLKRNWFGAISLVLPAFRALAALRYLWLARAAIRGARLISVVSSANRGMNSLRRSMSQHGFSYVVGLTFIVTSLGAAGMYAFENEGVSPAGFRGFGEALWWTAMTMTTLGSSYEPLTVEGRLLALLLAVYAFAVFGYVTAALASYLVGRDADNPQAEVAGAREIAALRADIANLRAELQAGVSRDAERDGPTSA